MANVFETVMHLRPVCSVFPIGLGRPARTIALMKSRAEAIIAAHVLKAEKFAVGALEAFRKKASHITDKRKRPRGNSVLSRPDSTTAVEFKRMAAFPVGDATNSVKAEPLKERSHHFRWVTTIAVASVETGRSIVGAKLALES